MIFPDERPDIVAHHAPEPFRETQTSDRESPARAVASLMGEHPSAAVKLTGHPSPRPEMIAGQIRRQCERLAPVTPAALREILSLDAHAPPLPLVGASCRLDRAPRIVC